MKPLYLAIIIGVAFASVLTFGIYVTTNPLFPSLEHKEYKNNFQFQSTPKPISWINFTGATDENPLGIRARIVYDPNFHPPSCPSSPCGPDKVWLFKVNSNESGYLFDYIVCRNNATCIERGYFASSLNARPDLVHDSDMWGGQTMGDGMPWNVNDTVHIWVKAGSTSDYNKALFIDLGKSKTG
ncbi:MAG: hypothetical protein KGI27_06225 [Thaumarchaeota archaeon]|nr:hypothetical protein [Nitrososphaerota archaeon]